MATLQERVSLLASRMGQECKTLHGKIGSLTDLPEAQRASLVAAIKNLNSSITTINGSLSTNAGNIATLQGDLDKVEDDLQALQEQVAAATNINDSAVGTTTTYSSSKIEDVVTAAKQAVKDDLLGGAGDAYDTLKELADLIGTNASAVEALQALAAGHVKFDGAQTLTDSQAKQARDNIKAAAAADLTALGTRVGTAEGKVSTLEGKMTAVEGKAAANESAIGGLTTRMGAVEKAASDNAAAISAHDTRLGAVEAKANAAATAEALGALAGRVTAVETKAGANETAIANLAAAVGNTDTDYVATFEAALV